MANALTPLHSQHVLLHCAQVLLSFLWRHRFQVFYILLINVVVGVINVGWFLSHSQMLGSSWRVGIVLLVLSKLGISAELDRLLKLVRLRLLSGAVQVFAELKIGVELGGFDARGVHEFGIKTILILEVPDLASDAFVDNVQTLEVQFRAVGELMVHFLLYTSFLFLLPLTK